MITKKGEVVKIIDDKTVKIEVSEYRMHPKYKKRYLRTKRFLVHNDGKEVKVGDKVTIKQSRPYSKRKHWILSTVTPS